MFAISKRNSNKNFNTMQAETLSDKNYLNHLLKVRNDFYNKGDYEKANLVTKDIEKLTNK